jgi:hypothetical protein
MYLYKFFNLILHLPNKLIFPLKNFDKNILNNFQHKGYLYRNFHNDKTDLFDRINLFINQKLDLNSIRDKSLKKNPNDYSVDVYDFLSENLKSEITNYLNNPFFLKTASSCLGYSVKFRRVLLLYNFYNSNNSEEEGPKMYHRDSDSLQDQIKLFILINDIDENNGMFYFVPKFLIKDYLRFKLLEDRKNLHVSNKWRISDNQLNNFIKNSIIFNKVKRFKGTRKEGLFIDTSIIYHKGGYVKEPNKYRILLQTVYTPKLSLSYWNEGNSRILTYFQTKLTSLKNKLRKEI